MPSEAVICGGTLVKVQTPIALHTDLRALVLRYIQFFVCCFVSDIVKQQHTILDASSTSGQNASHGHSEDSSLMSYCSPHAPLCICLNWVEQERLLLTNAHSRPPVCYEASCQSPHSACVKMRSERIICPESHSSKHQGQEASLCFPPSPVLSSRPWLC